MKIYVATHKLITTMPSDPVYVPLHVGAALHQSLPYQGDDTGDNISNKNPNFCELTGHYWIWKNSKEDIVGLVHYRRYFVDFPGYVLKLMTGRNVRFLSEKYIRKALSSYDAIVSTKGFSPKSKGNLIEAYGGSHHKKDILETEKVIKELFPEYGDAFDHVFSNLAFYPANMIICRKDTFDSYCQWLFPVLFEVERRIDISSYNDYQKRVYGFLSERIFYVWLYHNKLRLCERHIINTEDGSIFKIARKEIKRYFSIVNDKRA